MQLNITKLTRVKNSSKSRCDFCKVEEDVGLTGNLINFQKLQSVDIKGPSATSSPSDKVSEWCGHWGQTTPVEDSAKNNAFSKEKRSDAVWCHSKTRAHQSRSEITIKIILKKSHQGIFRCLEVCLRDLDWWTPRGGREEVRTLWSSVLLTSGTERGEEGF